MGEAFVQEQAQTTDGQTRHPKREAVVESFIESGPTFIASDTSEADACKASFGVKAMARAASCMR